MHYEGMKLIIALLLAGKLAAQQHTGGKEGPFQETFPLLKYDKVIAFNYNFDSLSDRKLYGGEKLLEIRKGLSFPGLSSKKVLTPEQTGTLISIVSDTATYGKNYADCFNPRLGFAFMKNDSVVFFIEVCFECRFLESTVTFPAARHKYYDISYTDTDITGKEVAVTWRRYLKGFSEAGLNRLQGLCEQLQMGYCKG